tara:strand:- start:3220 stop:4287 length:1068 start_codon:yes stop_codon:yes gene_type:complete
VSSEIDEMNNKTQRFLIAILRFHGDVLLTTPIISEIKRICPNSKIDMLVYKGTGSILENDIRINKVVEAEISLETKLIKRIYKELSLLKSLRSSNYDYGIFLTTQWRMALMARSLSGVKTTGVQDIKRDKPFWINSFSSIFPEAGSGHIVERNLNALKTLGFTNIDEKAELSLNISDENISSVKELKSNYSIEGDYCLFHPVSRRESKLWRRESFAELIDYYSNQGIKVVLTSGPDHKEREYLSEIEKLTKHDVINLGGKTSLLELSCLIREAKFFVGLDSVASHIAAAVKTKGVTLFGPSNHNNWKPWSDQISVISRSKEEFCKIHGEMGGKFKKCLCYISVERVIKEIDLIVR